MKTFSGTRAFEYARSISFPRLSSGSGERKAGDIIIGRLKSFGLEPEIQQFTYSSFPFTVLLRAALVLQVLLLLGTLFAARESPFPAVLMSLILILFLMATTKWGRVFEMGYDIGRQKPSRNIYKRVAGGVPHTNLIFLAHYDSKRQTIPILFRVVCYSLFYAGAIVLAVLLFVLSAAGSLAASAPHLLTAGIMLSLLTIPLVFNFTRDGSPGALDNASGVGIVLELARGCAAGVPDGLDVTFLFTGAEEEGLAGAVRFLQKESVSYKDRETFCVSYDGAGASGKIRVTSRYGIPPKKTSRELAGLIGRFCSERNFACQETYLPVGAGLEQTPVSFRGYDVVTIHSGKLGKAVLSIHSALDRPENLDPRAMEECGKIGLHVVKALSERKKESKAM